MPPLTQGIDHTAERRVIDPANLTQAQRSGMRCVYANCQRSLAGPKTFVGTMPDNSPLFACGDHEAAEETPVTHPADGPEVRADPGNAVQQ